MELQKLRSFKEMPQRRQCKFAIKIDYNLHLPRLELRTCCVWDSRDNHYTTSAGLKAKWKPRMSFYIVHVLITNKVLLGVRFYGVIG